MIIQNDNRITTMKEDKYKELIFAFCDVLKKNYGIKSYIMIHECKSIDRSNNNALHRLVLEAPFNEQPFNWKAKHYFSYWFDKRLIKSKPTYHKLFNSIFNNDFSCSFWLNDILYSTQPFHSFIALKVAVDLENVILHIKNALPNTDNHKKLRNVA